MHITVAEDLGARLIEIMERDDPNMESDARQWLRCLNYGQTEAVLAYVKGQITWKDSKVWKAKSNSERALLLVNQILHEAEFNKKNLSTKPRPKRN